MSKRLDKAAAFIAAAESGDADQFCYEQAAILIEEEIREDTDDPAGSSSRT